MTEHAVVIAGGGPTGLMLAAELALAGADVAIVERRASQDLVGSRAGGLHSRTIEVLDQRGIADRFLSQGKVAQVAGFAWIRLDISDFPTRHNYGLALWQNYIERILAGWVGELAVPIYRGREVTGFAQDDTGVDVELSDGPSLRADYLVGCDGGRSLIRKAAGIEFPGWDPTVVSQLPNGQLDFLAFNRSGALIASNLLGSTFGLPTAIGVAGIGSRYQFPFLHLTHPAFAGVGDVRRPIMSWSSTRTEHWTSWLPRHLLGSAAAVSKAGAVRSEW